MSTNIVRAWNNSTIRQREDGYLCLTDMAQANGKLFGHWRELKSTIEYLQALSESIGMTIDQLVQINESKGSNENRGTWGHRRVALRFAQWCSAAFAVQVDGWVEELLMKGTVSIANVDRRLVLLEQLTEITHKQIEMENRQQALEAEQRQIKADQSLLQETVLEHDAEIGRIFEPDGALITLAGFLNLHGKHATAAQLAHVGKTASKAYRSLYGKDPEKLGDARYGLVAAYPKAIAEEALKAHKFI